MIRMRKDVEYFSSKMGKIEGSGDLGDRLLGLVNAKTIATEPEPAETTSEAKKDEETKPEK